MQAECSRSRSTAFSLGEQSQSWQALQSKCGAVQLRGVRQYWYAPISSGKAPDQRTPAQARAPNASPLNRWLSAQERAGALGAEQRLLILPPRPPPLQMSLPDPGVFFGSGWMAKTLANSSTGSIKNFSQLLDWPAVPNTLVNRSRGVSTEHEIGAHARQKTRPQGAHCKDAGDESQLTSQCTPTTPHTRTARALAVCSPALTPAQESNGIFACAACPSPPPRLRSIDPCTPASGGEHDQWCGQPDCSPGSSSAADGIDYIL